MANHAVYLRIALGAKSTGRNTRTYAIRETIKIIQRSQVKFDAVACSGVSGITLGSIIAYRFNKPLIVVRKPEDSRNHSGRIVESGIDADLDYNGFRYIIIDDLIAGGNTLRHIGSSIRAVSPKGIYVGAFTVNDKEFIHADRFGMERFSTLEPQASYFVDTNSPKVDNEQLANFD